MQEYRWLRGKVLWSAVVRIALLIIIGTGYLACSDEEPLGESDAGSGSDAGIAEDVEGDFDAGEVLSCSEEQTYYRGTCYPSCDEESDCGADNRCYQNHCAPLNCEGVECRSEESCYLGVCYPFCEEDTQCEDGASCIEGACLDPCEQVQCSGSMSCYRGVCYEACDQQGDCDESARCAEDRCLPLDCSTVSCGSDQICYFGVCYGFCDSDDQCVEEGEVCVSNACAVPSCDDGLQSGDQTDVDCGGSCDPCPASRQCLQDSDCESQRCEEGRCASGCDEDALPFGGGAGDEGDPWLICSAAQLNQVAGNPGHMSAHFLVVQDLDLNELSEDFNVIGAVGSPFAGKFDGDQFIISNLTLSLSQTSRVGFFGTVGSGGVISGVVLENVDLSAEQQGGAVAGYNEGLIEDSRSSGQIVGTRHMGGLVGINGDGGVVRRSESNVNVTAPGLVTTERQFGGLVGDNFGRVEDSMAEGTIEGAMSIGGLVGVNWEGATIENSHATGQALGEELIGGLVGANGQHESMETEIAVIQGSYATGDPVGGEFVGGLVGNNAGEVHDSWSSGQPSGTNSIGGLTGSNDSAGLISMSYATGDCEGQNNVGGLSGQNFGMIQNSYAEGHPTGFQGVGGLVGASFAGEIRDSYATGDPQGEAHAVGGLVGGNEGEIHRSYAEGSPTATQSLGGLVGSNRQGALISASFAMGDPVGEENVGGLVGYNHGEIEHSYAQGNPVATVGFSGGLVGVFQEGVVRNSYCTGVAGGGGAIGGLIAWRDGSAAVNDSYWNSETGPDVSAGGSGLNSAQFGDPASFAASWIFCPAPDCRWVMPTGGPPELDWQ